MPGRSDDDDLFKKMFESFVHRKTRGSSNAHAPRHHHPTPPPPPPLRRTNTGLSSRASHGSSQLRPLRSSYHPPPTTSAHKHPRHSEPRSSGLGGLFGLRHAGDGSRGHGAHYGGAASKRAGKSSKSSKGSKGGSKGSEKVPSASTEDAPPRKKSRVIQRSGMSVDGVLLRTQSAHASLQSSTGGKMSKSRTSARMHLPTTTPPTVGSSRGGPSKPPSQKKFPCEKCEAVFAQNGQLSRHVRRVHDKLRPFACEHCGRLFGARSDRSRHVTIVHKKVRQFPCVRCGFQFQAKTHLEAHIRTVHDGQRPYSCDQCGFSFGLRSNLLTHQRAVHEKEAKWVCPICETAFNRKHDMHRHQKLMHEPTSGASASSSRRH